MKRHILIILGVKTDIPALDYLAVSLPTCKITESKERPQAILQLALSDMLPVPHMLQLKKVRGCPPQNKDWTEHS